MTSNDTDNEFDWVDRLPDVLHRWHELNSSEQEAIGRLVNRIASQPLDWANEGTNSRIRDWSSVGSMGIEVTTR